MTDASAAEIFDADAIDELARKIDLFESSWSAYLTGLGVDYLPLFYEDLVHEPRTWVARILAFLGVTDEWAGISRNQLQRQSDELTEDWVRRYDVLRNSP